MLVGQQQDLTVAVATLFPLAFAVCQAHAGQEIIVEAVKMLAVNNQIIEIRLDGAGAPNFLRRPVLGLVSDMDPFRAGTEAGADQKVGVADNGRLYNPGGAAFNQPMVLPEYVAML